MRGVDLSLGLSMACALLCCACAPAELSRPVKNPTPDAHAPDWRTEQDLLAVRMRSVAAGLSASGYRASVLARRGFLAAGARATYELHAPAGRCLTVVALGAAGINDLDAGIFEADGRAVAQDAASDARPVLRACGDGRDRRLYYVLHAYQGNGAYLMVAFEGPLRDGAAEVSAPAGDDETNSHSDWTAALVRRGFEPEGPPVDLDLSPGHPVTLPVSARDNQCLAVVAFASAEDADVDLKLTDESGQLRKTDRGPKTWAGAQLCPGGSGVFSVEVSVSGASTKVQVGRFSGRESRVGGERAMWLGDPPPVPAAVRSEAAGEPQPAPGKGAVGALVAGAVHEQKVQVPAGECAEIRPVLGKGLERVLVRVISPSQGALREAEREPAQPGLHVCGQGTKRLPVHIEARRGAGSYLLVAERANEQHLAQVQAAPARAREVLLDLWAAGDERDWKASEGLEMIPPHAPQCTDEAGCTFTRTVDVPKGMCVSAALVAADGSAVPLRLQASDRPDGTSREGLATRCDHDGSVRLRAQWPTQPSAPMSLLRFVHAPTKVRAGREVRDTR